MKPASSLGGARRVTFAAFLVLATAVLSICVPPAQAGPYRLSSVSSDVDCGVRAFDSRVLCWGDTAAALAPPASLGPVSVASGALEHVCAIKAADDTVVCWGSVGNPSYTQLDPPADLGPVAEMAVGSQFTCVIRSADRAVVCWGYDLADVTTAPPELGAASSVAAGDKHACAIRAADDKAFCWGRNFVGARNPRDPIITTLQATVPDDLGPVTAISAGYGHTCAVRKSNARVTCWGLDTTGQADPPADLGPVDSVVAGADHTCATRSTDGTVACWGSGQATVPPGLGRVSSLSLGRGGTCVIKVADGRTVCWGANAQVLLDPFVTLGPASLLTAGPRVDCAAEDRDGTLVCWGRPRSDEFGVPRDLGPVASVSSGNLGTCVVPAAAGALRCFGFDALEERRPRTTVASVSVGSYDHACAVGVDGAVSCWGGQNDDGEQTVPAGLGAATAVAAGNGHTCAVRAGDGRVRCWGRSDSGQTAVPDDLGPASSVAAGGGFSCAVRATDATVRCWGDDHFGQTDVPTGLGPVRALSATDLGACVLLSADSTVRCWGSNRYGQADVPDSLGAARTVATGVDHTCAIRAAGGAVVCWGSGGAPVPPLPEAQAIGFSTPTTGALQETRTLTATGGGSGETVVFRVATGSDPGACTLGADGVTLTLTGPGDCVVSADQAGAFEFDPAPTVTRTVRVGGRAQTITFGPLEDRTYGEEAVPLDATASSGLPVEYAVTTGTCYLMPGSRLAFTDAGACTVRAAQPGNGTFAAADPVDRVLTVRKATPVIGWSDPAPIDSTTPLSAAQLNATSAIPGTFTYDPPAGTTLEAGTDRPLTVTFRPAQASDYTPATKTVRITVTAAPSVPGNPGGAGGSGGTPGGGATGGSGGTPGGGGTTGAGGPPAAAGDTTPPTLAPRAVGNVYLGQKGARAIPGATDAGSGVATASCPPLDTRVAGLQKATCTATDRAGNTARKVLAYLVEYRLSAFLSPRASAAWRAGRPLPIRIRLTDAAGRPIPAAAAAALVSRSRTCRVTVASSGVQRLGRECMRYDAAGRRFTDVWTPARRPAGRVRLTVVVTYPGTTARTERSGTITLRPSR